MNSRKVMGPSIDTKTFPPEITRDFTINAIQQFIPHLFPFPAVLQCLLLTDLFGIDVYYFWKYFTLLIQFSPNISCSFLILTQSSS